MSAPSHELAGARMSWPVRYDRSHILDTTAADCCYGIHYANAGADINAMLNLYDAPSMRLVAWCVSSKAAVCVSVSCLGCGHQIPLFRIAMVAGLLRCDNWRGAHRNEED